MFERTDRKDDDGRFLEWKKNVKQPIIDIKFPFYMELEKGVYDATKIYLDTIGVPIGSVAST